MKKIVLPEEYNYISAFLTFRCNLNCSFCLNAFDKGFKRKREEISGKEWVEGLNRIESRSDVPLTFSGGEPFLHPEFLYIINNLRSDLKIDILTNLQWKKEGIDKFLSQVDPQRLKRESNYPSIRVSYHPEQMGNGEELVKNAKRLKDTGFNIGIYAVQFPSPNQLEAVTQMQFRCRAEGIDFRIKDFTGIYSGKDDLGREFSLTYGNYSKYPLSAFQNQTKSCRCKTSELLIGPNGDIYKCHKDVFAEDSPIGNLRDPKYQIDNQFRTCNNYGQCHPCDVKVKTNYKQQLGNTSVEITDIA